MEMHLLNGHVTRATNLVSRNYVLAIVADCGIGHPPAMLLVPHSIPGTRHVPGVALAGLTGTSAGSVSLTDVVTDYSWQLHADARVVLPSIRSMLWSMECGAGVGLASASLAATKVAIDTGSAAAIGEHEAQCKAVAAYWGELASGLDSGRLGLSTHRMAELRLRIIELARAAFLLEMRMSGAKIYRRGNDDGLARRLRELSCLSALVPVATPPKTCFASADNLAANLATSHIER
jgi:hypothetical protein